MTLHGLDLFSGIGGITLALRPWVTPVAYCENDRFAQAVLLSRMADGRLPVAPIWDDVRTLKADMLPPIDIIYGGFPCQDISNAGLRKGMEGERSGLFFDIARLACDLRPRFIFLENVAAIVNRGMGDVLREISAIGYDCRWTINRASDFGAPHLRARWWLLAHASSVGLWDQKQRKKLGRETFQNGWCALSFHDGEAGDAPDSNSNSESDESINAEMEVVQESSGLFRDWSTSARVCRVVDGLPGRVDRLRGLGNAVVPRQAQEAFKELMGLT